MSDFKRINIDIDKEIWKQVGSLASLEEMTKKDIVESALREFLLKYLNLHLSKGNE